MEFEIFSEIVEATSASEVLEHLQTVPDYATILFDIDDTIITPVSTTFRAPPYNEMIDEIKRDKEKHPNYAEIISNWRLQRKIMLVDPVWPSVINQLKESGPIYALTKVDSGAFGNIASMEEWRINELTSLGIEFSHNPNIQSKDHGATGPTFHKGVFFTGVGSKSQVLEAYHDDIPRHFIVMVDDRMAYLDDLKDYCKGQRIEFLGIFFKGVEKLPGSPNPDIAKYQKEYLINHATWLEDDKAMLHISSNNVSK